MINYRVIFTIFLFSSWLFGYEDSDIDGVDDSIDLCPDTSFDELVDEDGCPQSNAYWGTVTLQIGTDVALDKEKTPTYNYNFIGSYGYKEWYFSLSNTQQSIYDKKSNRSSNGGDIYLNGAYEFNSENFQTNVSAGLKWATASKTIGTGENDYIASVGINYFIDKSWMLFTQLSYRFIGESEGVNYQNSLASSLGLGQMINSKWYSSLSYDYSTSIYQEEKSYQSLSYFNSYSLSNNYFISFNYIYGLDSLSYPHIFSFNIGVTFE